MLALLTAVPLHTAAKKTVVLHTNDTHSCIMPLSRNLADTAVAGRGGFLRRAAMIQAERAKTPGLLLLDSGDFSQGSPFYTIFKGEVEVELMNRMGYDAVMIGNHEFDFGVENMARIFKRAKFPVICSNYDFTGTPLEGLVKPYTVVEREGVRIGIFGIGPELDGLVMEKTRGGVKYNDPVKTANNVVKTLKRKEKCDVIICLSHLGWDIEGLDDAAFTAQTHGIDLILGGHSHSYFNNLEYTKDLDGHPVPNDQNGKSGIYVGKITINME